MGGNHAMFLFSANYLNRNSDMLKEIALLEDYDETAKPPKRHREELPRGSPQVVLHHVNSSSTYPQPQPGSGSNTVAFSSPNPAYGAAHTSMTMAQSMAITPMASMPGVASISDRAPFPVPGASTSMSMSMYNPAPNPLAMDWDFGNLLMMQMGYSHYDPNSLFDMGLQESDQGHVAAASASPESSGNTEDLLSLFSDVPVAFR
jgi:hypothetical protein